MYNIYILFMFYKKLIGCLFCQFIIVSGSTLFYKWSLFQSLPFIETPISSLVSQNKLSV